MGLLDFFRRRKPEPLKEEGPSPEYALAHFALRSIALSNPLHFLALVGSDKAPGFFEAVLEDLEEQCGQKPRFDASSIKPHPTRVKNYPCVIIEMPAPQEIAEAYMVALVLLLDPSEEDLPDPKSLNARFFTLEKGFTLSGDPRTVLAEWTDSSHLNYGDGPPADVEKFCSALEQHFEAS